MSDTIMKFQTTITKPDWQVRLKAILDRKFTKVEIIEQGIKAIEQGNYNSEPDFDLQRLSREGIEK